MDTLSACCPFWDEEPRAEGSNPAVDFPPQASRPRQVGHRAGFCKTRLSHGTQVSHECPRLKNGSDVAEVSDPRSPSTSLLPPGMAVGPVCACDLAVRAWAGALSAVPGASFVLRRPRGIP